MSFVVTRISASHPSPPKANAPITRSTHAGGLGARLHPYPATPEPFGLYRVTGEASLIQNGKGTPVLNQIQFDRNNAFFATIDARSVERQTRGELMRPDRT